MSPWYDRLDHMLYIAAFRGSPAAALWAWEQPSRRLSVRSTGCGRWPFAVVVVVAVAAEHVQMEGVIPLLG